MDIDQGTFIVGRSKLEAGQTLAPDLSTYELLHSLSTPWPCLSFDLVRDSLGDNRKVYPATMYAVAGTQADSNRSNENELMIMKLSGLSRMNKDANHDGSDDEDNSDDEEDADPILESRSIPLNTTTNRVRVHQIPSASTESTTPTTFVAAMTESSQVYIYDITAHLTSFEIPGTTISPQQNKPVSTIRAHKTEGYAIDFAPLPSGNASATARLLTGDNDGFIYLTSRTQGGGWVTNNLDRPFRGHEGSVEDIQWSPSESSVFASCGGDGTVRVWDTRSKSRAPAITVRAAKGHVDVNVISWSRSTTHLLASGADDGEWGVWDLRQWKPSTGGSSAVKETKASPLASFNYHKEPITSLEWHPTDDSIVAVSSADNTVTLWDLAVELDDEESKDTGGVKDVPPQLLFVHFQKSVKEIHWHPQVVGTIVATGDEWGVFRTISV